MSTPIKIEKDGVLYAMFFSSSLSAPDGVNFLNNPEDSLQIGLMERPTGYKVEPHLHPSRSIPIERVSEFLYIEKGKVKATVTDEEWNVLGEHELSEGDFLLFLRGGHSVEVIEEARMIEVKQGPFLGDNGAKVYKNS
ncbi:hypothetical protein HN512_02810 [Candidatus Peregrinibacteria bacterium]|jgi:hypothetical protein|nr:hypothetical protein [Candidatus Peregrinibacteria bacterium]MBT3598743.1 hypothetical protein [Candidatus Peregrinibacteria bacterium]MBT6731247.1 hypothetical protein [Candidatus Peregrinibacteria bacterium]MBT7008825.1 hypothetical protein [Candidatus Peregrinibacteria bacterium]MBT7344568.1 hypothetical protein [Candidatus Peregrinibacteria bacterium]